MLLVQSVTGELFDSPLGRQPPASEQSERGLQSRIQHTWVSGRLEAIIGQEVQEGKEVSSDLSGMTVYCAVCIQCAVCEHYAHCRIGPWPCLMARRCECSLCVSAADLMSWTSPQHSRTKYALRRVTCSV